MTDIREPLVREIARRARIAPGDINPDAHFVIDMGMSSLDLLSVLAYAEKLVGMRLPDEQLVELTTLNKVLDALARLETGQE